MDNRGNIVIYQTKDGKTSIDVKLENETVWLTQAQMADLFQKDRTVIGRHINNVYREGELERDITCAKFAHVGSDNDQQYVCSTYVNDCRKPEFHMTCCHAMSFTIFIREYCMSMMVTDIIFTCYHVAV